MAKAEASQTRLAIVPEVTPGVIPDDPTWQVTRYTSESIKVAKQTVTSDEIRADGNVTDHIDVGRSASGPLNCELSYGTFDLLFESLFRAAWATNVLTNGIVHKTFSLEKTFEQGATDSFIRYRGCRVDTLDLQMETRQIIKANFGLVGIGSPTPTTDIIEGATYTAPTTVQVLNSATNVGALTVGGVVASPKIKTLNIQIRSNLYQNDVLGQYEPDDHGLGRFEVTGNMVAYFETLDLYNAIIDHADVSLTTTLGAVTNQKYTLAIPAIKLMEGSPVAGGNSQAVMLDIPFSAKFAAGIGGTARLTRAVA